MGHPRAEGIPHPGDWGSTKGCLRARIERLAPSPPLPGCSAAAPPNIKANRKAAAMDAPNPSSTVTFANRTPLRIGTVGLKARDLSRLTDFYSQAVGLNVLDRDSETARLGAGGVTLLELEAAPNATADDPRTAGLYHTAFLQPTRGDLARWLVHVASNRVPLTGASDHLVSEAIYLDDPEGNGIEVYRDRLPQEWRWNGDRIQMATDRLDLDNLAAQAGNASYAGAPEGLRIGHIHLRVGDLDTTRRFYSDVVGLNPTAGRGGALFMSSGRYHHHVGSNTWHSAGAGKRDDARAGLSWFAIEAADTAQRDAALEGLRAANVPLVNSASGPEARDPFGIRVRFAG